MNDHQFRQLLDVLAGINTSLSSIARTLESCANEEAPIDLGDAIERGRLFGRD